MSLRLLMLCLLASACGFAHRTRKAFVPAEFVTPAADSAELAEVRYTSGYGDEPEMPWDPATLEIDGRTYARPVPITSDGWIEARPDGEPVRTQVWIRRTGVTESGFLPVPSITGALRHRVANEVRFFDDSPDDEPRRIVLADLRNPYNGYRFEDGDLLLLTVSDREQTRTERYLFRYRDFGWQTHAGAGVLVPTPIPGLAEDVQSSPALVVSLVVGYRFRSKSPVANRVNDAFALVGSLGVGSTVLSQEGAIDQQVSGAFNAAVAGGGVQVLDFVSLQALVNLSAYFRTGTEATWTPAIGFDAVQFSRFTRRIVTRLFKRNELEQPPPP